MIIQGDCRTLMAEMPEASVDAIVTDPPYELAFMGRAWDASGVAFDPDTWRAALRVLKPGGHLLAFGGSRTYHRLACAIEDAGFEIRDQIMWIYGSGFPKSLDVSKAIDKADGTSAAREIIADRYTAKRIKPGATNHAEGGFGKQDVDFTATDSVGATERSRAWDGWGTALKPAHEPIVMARKPLVGTVAANVLAHGTGAINVDGCRIEGGSTLREKPAAPGSFPHDDDAWTPRDVVVGSVLGRWPANVIHDGSDEVVALFPANAGACAPASGETHSGRSKSGSMAGAFHGMGDRAPAFHADSGSAARFFYCAKASKADRDEGLADFAPQAFVQFQTANGTSGKASSLSEGRETQYRNIHPTVKPTALMRYLCRLATPPGGLVFDPFAGSGSTGKAAILEGFRFVGCELTEEYLPIARARIAAAEATTRTNDQQPSLFGERAA